MWFLQVSDGLDWVDMQELDKDTAEIACSIRPRINHEPMRVVSRQMLPDGYVDTVLADWPASRRKQE